MPKCSHCNNEICPKGCLYAEQRFKGHRDTTVEMHNHLVQEHQINWDHIRQATSALFSAESFHESLHKNS